VVAHLDPDRRGALFSALARLGAQVWMSGADPAAFANVGAGSEIFQVNSGRIVRRPP
jgi:DNA replication and repair protein RecF